MEYNIRASGDNIFKQSLRDGSDKQYVKYFKNSDTSDITNYLNWQSNTGRRTKSRQANMSKQVTDRLTTGSPNRETTINYVLGTGEGGQTTKVSVPCFQGFQNSYKSIKRNTKNNLSNEKPNFIMAENKQRSSLSFKTVLEQSGTVSPSNIKEVYRKQNARNFSEIDSMK